MIYVAAIVEGPGDVASVPALVAKAGTLFGVQAVTSNPIKAGEWKKLRRTGEFERTLTLAESRGNDMILVLLDLEDDCVLTERKHAEERIEQWRGERNVRVEVVFLNREYETLFLCNPECLGQIDNTRVPPDPFAVRGAKEKVREITGRRYKETQDQVRFTKALNGMDLFRNCRPFRGLCKSLTATDYDILDVIL